MPEGVTVPRSFSYTWAESVLTDREGRGAWKEHALAKRLRDGTDGTLCVELFPALEDALRPWFNLPFGSTGFGFAEKWTVYP